MILSPMKQLLQLLDGQDLIYNYNAEDQIVNIPFAGVNMPAVEIAVAITEELKCIGIYVIEYIEKVPLDKMIPVLKTINQLNCDNTCCKFVLEEETSSIEIRMETYYPESEELGAMLASLLDLIFGQADGAYPLLMKAIWS